MLQVNDKVVITNGFGANEEGIIVEYIGGTKVVVKTENDMYYKKMYQLRKIS